MKTFIIYRCYQCNIKKVFDFNSVDDVSNAYIKFDTIHHFHDGFVMVQKVNNVETINKILKEWNEYYEKSKN